MSFSQLSQNKTQHLLGSIVDLSKEPAHGDADGYRSVSGSRNMSCPVRADREYLLSKARSFRDLETLFVALDALERWKDIADRMLGFVLVSVQNVVLMLTLNARLVLLGDKRKR